MEGVIFIWGWRSSLERERGEIEGNLYIQGKCGGWFFLAGKFAVEMVCQLFGSYCALEMQKLFNGFIAT